MPVCTKVNEVQFTADIKMKCGLRISTISQYHVSISLQSTIDNEQIMPILIIVSSLNRQRSNM